MHFPTLLTFRLQRPHIALQTFRFQHIISAHVTLLPIPSGPGAKSLPMPQGYTERLAVMQLVGNTLLPSGLTLRLTLTSSRKAAWIRNPRNKFPQTGYSRSAGRCSQLVRTNALSAPCIRNRACGCEHAFSDVANLSVSASAYVKYFSTCI